MDRMTRWHVVVIALALLACDRSLASTPHPDGAPAHEDGGHAHDGGPIQGQDAGPIPRPLFERYIRGDLDRRLVIELDAVSGIGPRPAAVTDVVARLSGLLDKPDGIQLVPSDTLATRGRDHAWTFADLAALARERFDDDPTPGTVAMHVLWVDGHYETDSSTSVTLGLAWGHRHIVMFHDTIEAACDGLILREQVCTAAQTSVWLHEVGHVIGLVDNGLPMVRPHRDADHGAHDASDQCLMYWAFEGRGGVQILRDRLLGGGAMIDFDDACRADIAAIRDR